MTTPNDIPAAYRMPGTAALGRVVLQVGDLDRSVAFYQRTLGLRLLGRDERRALLGPQGGDTSLVELVARRGARPVPQRGRLGLYHFALLLPDRPSLGRFVRHLGEINARAGAADHLVSEAFYLQDPDNLGIEVYADRPRSAWRRSGGQLQMASDPVDMAGLLDAAGEDVWSGMPAGTVMGHLHLHVGDIAEANRFFNEVVGFDPTVSTYPGALFLAAGDYHHHLGVNTWAGQNATAPLPDDAQLLQWNIALPDASAVEAAAEQLSRAGHAAAWEPGGGFLTRDPWGTPLRIAAR
jgi:catechol 2,3-dioxygenase